MLSCIVVFRVWYVRDLRLGVSAHYVQLRRHEPAAHAHGAHYYLIAYHLPRSISYLQKCIMVRDVTVKYLNSIAIIRLCLLIIESL